MYVALYISVFYSGDFGMIGDMDPDVSQDEEMSVRTGSVLNDLDLVLTNISLLISQGNDPRLVMLYDELLSIRMGIMGESRIDHHDLAIPKAPEEISPGHPIEGKEKDCTHAHSVTDHRAMKSGSRSVIEPGPCKGRESSGIKVTGPSAQVKAQSISKPVTGARPEPMPITGPSTSPALEASSATKSVGKRKSAQASDRAKKEIVPRTVSFRELLLPLPENVRKRLEALGYTLVDR